MTEQRKLSAIMFTDLVGYSALSQRDEALALELLEEHRQLLRPHFAQYNGTEIKTIGDAFLVEFASAVEAARCAIDIQKTMKAHTSVVAPERCIQVRIGLHVGDVVIKEGDILGDGVNIASRIEPLAQPGGICVSEDVARQIENKLDLPLELLGEKELKGIKKPVTVYRLVLPWEKKAGFLRRTRLALRKPSSARLVLAGMLVLLIAAGGVWWWTSQRVPSIRPGQITRLAVLPFANLMNDPDQEYFVDGIHDALLTELAKIGGMTVISRQSVMRYKGSDKPLREIASELQAHALIEGSVLRAGDDVRVNVQLIEAAADRHLWAEVFDRKLENVLALHSDVVRAVAGEIKAALTPEQEARLDSARQVNPETYEAYLKGMFYLNKFETKKGLAYFNQAIENDPADPLAYAGLALGYVTIGHSNAATPDVWPRARAAALTALRLDETLAEGHSALAEVKAYYEWDWEGAEQAFLRADELNSNLAMNHYHYAWYLALFGRLDEAIVEHKRAQELDPLTPHHTIWLGGLYRIGGDYEKAIAEIQKVLELNPDHRTALRVLGDVLADAGMYEEAIAAYQKVGISGDLGRTYALAGRQDEARKILAELEEKEATPGRAWGLAILYTALGEKDEAFRWLAYEPPYFAIPWVRVLPQFEPLWDDPRFKDLLQRMNLPER
ncbi:MAG: tetratricopeptide repeat protein [Candidatus Glassbacteria bacterium]|nr:tetratricopeptide repeat protein [Candidatus Glassbacteria bacterium]